MHAHWLDGEPITELTSMAGVVDRHREFVVDGQPVATGILTVADAASCTNPSLGRGISLGLMHGEVMRECVREHLDDPRTPSPSRSTNGRMQEIRPWHDATTSIDRRRVREMRVFRDGGEPTPSDEERLADVLQAAVTLDPVITRGLRRDLQLHLDVGGGHRPAGLPPAGHRPCRRGVARSAARPRPRAVARARVVNVVGTSTIQP